MNERTPASAGRPDFSGAFRLDRQASQLSPAVAASIRGATLRIEHQAERFRCQFAFAFEGQTFDGSFELTTDGRETSQKGRGGDTVSTLQWEGDSLVFTSRGERTTIFRYELLDGGRRLRASETLRGTDHDQDNVWVYERE